MAKDYYETLGVKKNSSKEEIRTAYKNLAKKYHPDLNKDKGAEDKFKEINQAYSSLSDDKKRAQYDQFGESAERMGGGGYSDFASSGAGFGGGNFEDVFGDVFENFFGGQFSGRSGSRRNNGRKGNDLRFDLDISLDEAYSGTIKTIIIPKEEKCSNCKGTGAENESDIETCSDCNGSGYTVKVQRTPIGMFQQQVVCRTCGGTGQYVKTACSHCDGEGVERINKKLEIKIPKGVDSDTKIRMTGEGEPGERGGQTGDLYIFCNVLEHDIFDRREDDLYTEVDVPFTMVCLGGEISIPTLDGEVKLKIPMGTQSNTLFRLKEKGMPKLRHSGNGDLFVKCVVSVPDKLSSKQKEILKEFEKTLEKKSFFRKIKEVFE
ncbi:MAG: molecular chaperone DnaJ [Candidatus Woesearchaeota archaeon]